MRSRLVLSLKTIDSALEPNTIGIAYIVILKYNAYNSKPVINNGIYIPKVLTNRVTAR
ncbi:MAG: hypothetical protein ACTTIF_03665 [Prevotella sp.]